MVVEGQQQPGGRRHRAAPATYAADLRRVVITRPLSRLAFPEQLLDFGFYGIGVVLQHPDGDLETLVEPRPWRPKRHTPNAWWFEERAYEQFLKQSPSQAPELSPSS